MEVEQKIKYMNFLTFFISSQNSFFKNLQVVHWLNSRPKFFYDKGV